jgi:acetyltransferase-like isoleucine patch superfamily enzyme
MSSAAQLAFRVLRGLVVRPVTGWYHRQDTYQQLCHLAECGQGVAVRSPIHIGNPASTRLGDGVNINPGFTTKGSGDLRIGPHTHFGWDITILTDDHNYEGADEIPYDRTRNARAVEIGEACWLGDRVIVAPGARLGAGCVVGAGAVVAGHFPDHSVLVGAPARVVKDRDGEHFERLRKEGRFLGAGRRGVVVDGRALPHPATS